MNVPKHTFKGKTPSMSIFGGRVLWGRVIFLGTSLFLVFLFGLLIGTSGGDGISQETFRKEQEKVKSKDDEISGLQTKLKLANEKLALDTAQLAAAPVDAQAGDQQPADQAEAAAEQTEQPAQTTKTSGQTKQAASSSSGQTYTTQKGDTLWGIAKKFYGNGSRWTVIAEANGLSKDSPISSGMKLKIPAKAS